MDEHFPACPGEAVCRECLQCTAGAQHQRASSAGLPCSPCIGCQPFGQRLGQPSAFLLPWWLKRRLQQGRGCHHFDLNFIS